jgi:hypothetical protein
MHPPRCRCLVLAAAICLAAPAAALAQPTPESPRSYVRIPLEKDLDTALAEQFLKALLKDPGTLKHLRAKITEMGQDPVRRKAIDKVLSGKASAAQLKKLGREIQKAEKARSVPDQNPLPASPPSSPPERAGPMPEEVAPPPLETPPGEDLIARWARDLLEEADSEQWDELVKKSPALQEGLKELQQLLEKGGAGGGALPSDLARWAGNLRPWSKDLPRLPGLSWLNPRTLSLPSLPVPALHMPRVGSLPGVPRLHLHLPHLGGAPPNGRTLAQGSIWLAVLGLAALGCWYVLRRKWHAAGQTAAAAQLGPWPVDPAQVRTPAELIRAFEYLSVLMLGSAARSWNHRTIAAQLSGPDVPARQAADELAFLYEQARYAPPADQLPDEALAMARRALCFLAGVAMA